MTRDRHPIGHKSNQHRALHRMFMRSGGARAWRLVQIGRTWEVGQNRPRRPRRPRRPHRRSRPYQRTRRRHRRQELRQWQLWRVYVAASVAASVAALATVSIAAHLALAPRRATRNACQKRHTDPPTDRSHARDLDEHANMVGGQRFLNQRITSKCSAVVLQQPMGSKHQHLTRKSVSVRVMSIRRSVCGMWAGRHQTCRGSAPSRACALSVTIATRGLKLNPFGVVATCKASRAAATWNPVDIGVRSG